MRERLKDRAIDLLFALALVAIALWAIWTYTTGAKVHEVFTGQCQQIEDSVKEKIAKDAVDEYIAANPCGDGGDEGDGQ